MGKKIFGTIIVFVVAMGLLFFFWDGAPQENTNEQKTENRDNNAMTTSDIESKSEVEPGTYTVVSEQSKLNWSARKPLIDDYVNSGTIDVTGGTIEVSDTEATGNFTLDMNTLDVGLTAKKPGQEGSLEGHLKGERFFDVATYPTAEFVITKTEKTPDSDTNFTYNLTGDLTLKGTTEEITFPATIYQDDNEQLYANGTMEIDRTRWGITFGSGNFFDDLGDNLISDTVSISFSLVAKSN